MTGREAAKVRKAARLLREADEAIREYIAEPSYGPGKRLPIARAGDAAKRGAEELERALVEEGRR